MLDVVVELRDDIEYAVSVSNPHMRHKHIPPPQTHNTLPHTDTTHNTPPTHTHTPHTVLSRTSIVQAVAVGLSHVRDGYGCTPNEVLELLALYLAGADNRCNPYSDAHLLAAFLEAVGSVHIRCVDRVMHTHCYGFIGVCTDAVIPVPML